ncbi:hypothetical protein D3C73_1398940 [compost metagenome]
MVRQKKTKARTPTATGRMKRPSTFDWAMKNGVSASTATWGVTVQIKTRRLPAEAMTELIAPAASRVVATTPPGSPPMVHRGMAMLA